ncbi:divalent-cation tolerance protein CutA [Qipengyuania sp. JC766]|uniref:divalent-cation tolerance protein CutA n=1 Tax=Qipengyuania sp. JC766 TaxID=3232139 RepID=UPI00345A4B34
MSALIWSPFADEAQARAAAATLIEERLVACANLLPAMVSVFAWKGAVQSENECAALFKTDEALLDEAIARLADIHPYETPAIMGWPCRAGEATAAWLREQTGAQG